MKTLLQTFLLIGMLTAQSAMGQYYYITYSGSNPGGLNNDVEYPEGGGIAAGWNKIYTGPAATPVWTNINSIPFAFNFNGSAVTHYKVSTSGVLTFDTAAATAPTVNNTTLPSNAIPDKSVCFWGISSGSNTDNIFTKVFGTAPNRQLWVQFNSFAEAGLNTGYLYASIVLEETSNKIYIVDQRSSGTNTTLTIGVQVNGTSGFQTSGAPNSKLFSSADATPGDNYYYEFINGVQPAKDMIGMSLNLSKNIGLNMAPVTLTGKVRNIGSANISSIKLSYQINGGTPVESPAINATINSLSEYAYSHPTAWNPGAVGTYTVKVWVSEINGGADENHLNDTMTKIVNVIDAMVPRKALHEIFTSSTCPPCKPGNEQMHKVMTERLGTYTVIKYQYFGPGTGDPYFTPECYNRAVYYGQTVAGTAGYSVPDLYVDGGWGNNPNGYSTSVYDQFQEKPAFVEITPTLTLNGKTVTVSATIKPIIDFPAGSYKIRMAIVEKTTTQNVKTNGETEFNYVLKKMLPDENGKDFTFPAKNTTATVSETYSFNGDFKLPVQARTTSSIVPTGAGYSGVDLATNHTVEEFEDLAVVVFIQNNTTKEVLQSEWTAQGFPVGLANETAKENRMLIYPNPAQNLFAIDLGLADEAEVAIVDISGKTVLTKVISSDENTIGTESLNNGMYFVQVKVAGKTSIHKLIIQK